MNKKLALLWAMAAVCWADSARAQAFAGFDDVDFWVGTGTNRAALVLQWNEGGTPASLVWGYRWNGSATGFDMLTAIAGSSFVSDTVGDPVEIINGNDPRLVLGITRYNFGDALESITFQDATGSRTRQDWLSGFWEYFISGGQFEYYDWLNDQMATYDVPGTASYSAVSWTSSPVGASDRPLVDGSWDALSFAPNFTSQPVQTPAPIGLPVPAAALTVGAGGEGVAVSSVVGLTYRLAATDSLSGEFVPVGPSLPGTGGPLVLTDPATNAPTTRFYRVLVTQ